MGQSARATGTNARNQVQQIMRSPQIVLLPVTYVQDVMQPDLVRITPVNIFQGVMQPNLVHVVPVNSFQDAMQPISSTLSPSIVFRS
jgi:hypothetical protein